MKKLKFEKYYSTIDAVKYKDGMESGFITRYAIEDEYEAFLAGTIDSFGTYGFTKSKYPIQVPFIKQGKTKIMMGNGYYLIKEINREGEMKWYSMHEKEFKSKYKKLAH